MREKNSLLNEYFKNYAMLGRMGKELLFWKGEGEREGKGH
jgi:hypothetical protein